MEPTEPTPAFHAQDREGIALCLSGGGYRAMLFHVGALRRLNELGWLPKLDFVCSVSGGSITAAVLARQWDRLAFADDVAGNFEAVVEAPLRKFADQTIDTKAVLGGLFRRKVTIGDRTAALLDKHLLSDATLQTLPDKPRFVFLASNLQSGTLWRFSKGYMRDYRVGCVEKPVTTLARVVAASAAFPPFLSPVILDTPAEMWTLVETPPPDAAPWPPKRVILSDGGVYDNLGIEPVFKRCAMVLVSDGGGRLGYRDRIPSGWLPHLRRVLSVVDSQVRSLRKRQLIDAFKRGLAGTYWGIRTNIDDFELVDALPAPVAATRRLAAVPTRLAKTPRVTQDRLINWGYAVSDAGLRRWVGAPNQPAAAFPYPGGVGPV